jgi:hypothetical protein
MREEERPKPSGVIACRGQAVGADLEVDAVWSGSPGRRLQFAVRLRDSDRPVASVRVARVVGRPATRQQVKFLVLVRVSCC